MDAGTSQTQSTEAFYRFLAWLHANQKRLFIGAGVVIGLGLIAGIMAFKKSQDAANANERLFNLPVASPAGTAMAVPPASAYLTVAQDYPNTSAGEYAQLLGAESLFVNGKYPEAQHEFSKYAEEHPDSALVAQAQMGVAASLEAEGKTADAIQKYTTILSTYPNDLSISEPAKLTLARLDEQANRPDQALALYSELARSQNPYDPWAAEARERGQLLLAKHPELQRAEAAAAPGNVPIALPQQAAPGAAPTPAPQKKQANPAANLLNFPAASSNLPGKP
jgi:predicted negative regulator of RcsB-dependent stress response